MNFKLLINYCIYWLLLHSEKVVITIEKSKQIKLNEIYHTGNELHTSHVWEENSKQFCTDLWKSFYILHPGIVHLFDASKRRKSLFFAASLKSVWAIPYHQIVPQDWPHLSVEKRWNVSFLFKRGVLMRNTVCLIARRKLNFVARFQTRNNRTSLGRYSFLVDQKDR